MGAGAVVVIPDDVAAGDAFGVCSVGGIGIIEENPRGAVIEEAMGPRAVGIIPDDIAAIDALGIGMPRGSARVVEAGPR